VLDAVFFSMERNDHVIARSSTARLLCCIFLALGLALGAALLGRIRTSPATGKPLTLDLK
jgi:hypothetical protein